MIPILINCRDRYTWTRDAAEACRNLPQPDTGQPTPVILVDNASTHPPLLEWYRWLDQHPEAHITVHRLGQNLGPRAPWSVPLPPATTHFVVTDPDLELVTLPGDTLLQLRQALALHPQMVKVGTALRIDDLPDTSVATTAKAGETRYWGNPYLDGQGLTWWIAPIDTTFAMYRTAPPHAMYEPALRLDGKTGEYQVRHLPWYIQPDAVPEEERYYLAHAERLHELYYTPRLLHTLAGK